MESEKENIENRLELPFIHTALMMKNGYKIINQEVEKHGKVSRKFCVGYCNKFHSD